MMNPAWESGSKKAFWEVVARCLVDFFGFDERAAHARVDEFRDEIDRRQLGQPQLVYHSEPFNLACDLGGKPLDLDAANAERYSKILQDVTH